MSTYETIAAKRDGRPVSPRDLTALVDGITDGTVSRAQAAAFCMAVVLQGMGPDELAVWTCAIADSGERLTWDAPSVDKHSTGGVGDKSSLVIAPLLAAAGLQVPMLSGRSLGHTGGTLDKLEAVDGYTAELDRATLSRVLDAAGCAIAAASPTLAPADRVLYSVRDETATVASVPLIASSIVSKKLAAGAHGLVLDVKAGSAAFLPQLDQARTLAETMVDLCVANGLPARAAITRMDVMTGRACGNAAEVQEALDALAGAGDPVLRALCLDLAHAAAVLVAPCTTRAQLERLLDDGSARERFERMLVAQGAADPTRVAQPRYRTTVEVDGAGTYWIDALTLAHASAALGSTRAAPGALVDVTTGIWREFDDLDRLSPGATALVLECDDASRLERGAALARQALRRVEDDGDPEFGTHAPVLEWVDAPRAPQDITLSTNGASL